MKFTQVGSAQRYQFRKKSQEREHFDNFSSRCDNGSKRIKFTASTKLLLIPQERNLDEGVYGAHDNLKKKRERERDEGGMCEGKRSILKPLGPTFLSSSNTFLISCSRMTCLLGQYLSSCNKTWEIENFHFEAMCNFKWGEMFCLSLTSLISSFACFCVA